MTTTIKINGPLVRGDDKWVYDFFGMEATSAPDVLDNLPADNSEVEININSGGGLVDVGAEIYTALRAYTGQVTVNVMGMAASAASIIAMAGDTVKMSPVARIMIHNASAESAGDYRAMDKMSDMLKNANDALSNAYMIKTGMDKDTLLNLMNETTYLTADKAKELGFIDEVMFESSDEPSLVASEPSTLLPKSVIDKVRNMQDVKNTTVNLSAPDLKPMIQKAIAELKATTVIDGKTLNEWDELNNKQKDEAPKTTHVFGSFLI
ncbi:head maturation protease, ClpP-related [Latilactobacillus sakei]|uniref:head maturation protease, ClpP-related n=1 Tax=Latilactobacillus sakei TaxID=1599 RepID=UPI003F53CADF